MPRKKTNPGAPGALAAAPARRAKRRQTARRCRNCNEPFPPSREWQEFCAENCRKEFHRAGGVSIERLRPIIAEMVAAALQPLQIELAAVRRQIEARQ